MNITEGKTIIELTHDEKQKLLAVLYVYLRDGQGILRESEKYSHLGFAGINAVEQFAFNLDDTLRNLS